MNKVDYKPSITEEIKDNKTNINMEVEVIKKKYIKNKLYMMCRFTSIR